MLFRYQISFILQSKVIESFYETKFVTQKCVLEQIQQQPEKRKEKPQHRSRIMMK